MNLLLDHSIFEIVLVERIGKSTCFSGRLPSRLVRGFSFPLLILERVHEDRLSVLSAREKLHVLQYDLVNMRPCQTRNEELAAFCNDWGAGCS